MAPGSLQRSEASRPWSIAVVAPDPTEPKPCSRLLICLQINQQTIAGKIAARKAALTGGLLNRRRTNRREMGPTAKPSRCRSLLWSAAHLRVANRPNRRHRIYDLRDAERQREVRSYARGHRRKGHASISRGL